MKATGADPVSDEWLHQFDAPAPHYSSYPTTDRFVEAFSSEAYVQSLRMRHVGVATLKRPLSLYVHLPFCAAQCYHCACNKMVTRKPEPVARYLQYLAREVSLHVDQLGIGQHVTHLHLGGGTPTFLSDGALRDLMDLLRRNFTLVSGGEYSIEVDPRTVTAGRFDTLAELGFNRLSFGVVDFDPDVQKAVHRLQPLAQVMTLMQAARERRFDSITVDLIYGLPRQSEASFAQTLARLLECRPERIALHAYTHQPERHPSQRRIDASALPDAAAKRAMLSRARTVFLQAGYVYIGVDHFALPVDALAVAKRQGRLHRSFQGYSTQPDCDLIGLGVSSMGRIGATYSQNAQTLDEYCAYLDQDLLPVVRGLGLSRDDLVRRAVIMALMCHGEVLFESIELAYLLDFRNYFAIELKALHPLAARGLITLDPNCIQVTAMGWYYVSQVAAVFDRYLQADRTRARFSRII